MSKATAIKMLKSAIHEHEKIDMIGFRRDYLERIISELEEDEVTDLVRRIEDLEEIHRLESGYLGH